MMTMTMIPDMKNTFRTLTSTFAMFSGLDLSSPKSQPFKLWYDHIVSRSPPSLALLSGQG